MNLQKLYWAIGNGMEMNLHRFLLVSRRPLMGMEIGSTKRNRCRKCGLPVDSPLTLFWDCKNSPGFV